MKSFPLGRGITLNIEWMNVTEAWEMVLEEGYYMEIYMSLPYWHCRKMVPFYKLIITEVMMRYCLTKTFILCGKLRKAFWRQELVCGLRKDTFDLSSEPSWTISGILSLYFYSYYFIEFPWSPTSSISWLFWKSLRKSILGVLDSFCSPEREKAVVKLYYALWFPT